MKYLVVLVAALGAALILANRRLARLPEWRIHQFRREAEVYGYPVRRPPDIGPWKFRRREWPLHDAVAAYYHDPEGYVARLRAERDDMAVVQPQ